MTEALSLAGRKAIITGAGSGIGRAAAAQLRRAGALVFTADRQGEVDFLRDLTEEGANHQLVEAAMEHLGGIDILIACAGVTGLYPIEGHRDEDFDRMLAVNLVAPFRLIRDALPHLKQSQFGRIILIGSVMSSFGGAGMTAYAASKHAVLGMTKAAATELGPFGITVNCIQPGAIDTPMTAPTFQSVPQAKDYWIEKAALGRLGTPEDIADVAVFLSSDQARFMSGHGIIVDGGAVQSI